MTDEEKLNQAQDMLLLEIRMERQAFETATSPKADMSIDHARWQIRAASVRIATDIYWEAWKATQ